LPNHDHEHEIEGFVAVTGEHLGTAALAKRAAAETARRIRYAAVTTRARAAAGGRRRCRADG
jgi:hypothetical protein